MRFRVREGGRTRYRSIYLGPEPVAVLARQLIAQWRAEAVPPEKRRHRTTRQLLDCTAAATGFSKRARKRLDSAVEEAIDDPLALLRLVHEFDTPMIRSGRKPGRPSRSGLW